VPRIRRSRRWDRSWVAVVASGLGLYAVLAVGFRWFVEPAIVAGHSSLPTETLIAYAHRSSAEPATSGHSPRGVAQVSVDKREPPSPTDGVATAKAVGKSDVKAPDIKPVDVTAPDIKPADVKPPEVKAPDVKAPKREPHRTATTRTNDRVVQRSAEHRGASWGFSSSPASPNYR